LRNEKRPVHKDDPGRVLAMSTLHDLKAFSDGLTSQAKEMPALFVGHGSPMNGIEDNEFSLYWESLGKTLPLPRAVLVISAHWYTKGTYITALNKPKTIYDFHGFPQTLYDVKYPAPGDPTLAIETSSLVKKTTVGLDHEWGLDHGAWTVVRRMYPEANIPVLQFSIDYTKGAQYHYELAAELKALRKKGVLILGSGNMVHNLRILDWQNPENGYDWAIEINEKFKTLISSDQHKELIDYESLGPAARLSIPTPEHYLPMIYILGLKDAKDNISFFNDKTVMGSVSMTSFQFNQI
jgi:4,5-DOPA dioxygenase extradiol